MIDAKLLRTDFEWVKSRLAMRGFNLCEIEFRQLDEKRKLAIGELETLQSQRNAHAKRVGEAKSKGENIESLLNEAETLSVDLSAKKMAAELANHNLEEWLFLLPNIPDASVPEGKDESDNRLVHEWGTPRSFHFSVLDHVALGEKDQSLDFEAGSKLSGARFSVLKGDCAKLHRALAQFMLDTHSHEHGYMEVAAPYMVLPSALVGTGQLPKFEEDLFRVERKNQEPLYLIPTAEVTLSNLASGKTFEFKDLPLMYVSHSPCFRSEAGASGRDTRGMIRQHQFDKVEMVQVVHPETSMAALESITQHAETILQRLELPYRVMFLCAGDMGFGASKTYDLEVWIPSQEKYREISSCSNCSDFQARRMQARFKDPTTKKIDLLHTLNGSGLAVGRTMVALLENHQNEDGSVNIPKALQPYMHGETMILKGQ